MAPDDDNPQQINQLYQVWEDTVTKAAHIAIGRRQVGKRKAKDSPNSIKLARKLKQTAKKQFNNAMA